MTNKQKLREQWLLEVDLQNYFNSEKISIDCIPSEMAIAPRSFCLFVMIFCAPKKEEGSFRDHKKS